jgi:DNA-binding LacI/PurR family transcriptional regulator
MGPGLDLESALRDYSALRALSSPGPGVLTLAGVNVPEVKVKESVPPRERAGVTLEQVAELAGVSRATVSRVVNGSPLVSQAVKGAVEAAAERLGYVPNRAARSLVTRRSESVGLVIPEPTARLFGDPFFPAVARGISEVMTAHNLQLVLFMPQSAADAQRLVGYASAGHVDGMLFVSLHGADPTPARMAERGVPVVLGGRPLEPAHMSYVDVDNVAGAASAVAHLAGIGRTRIAAVAGPQDMVPGQDRLRGWRNQLRTAGLHSDPSLTEPTPGFTYEAGATAMRALLDRRPDLDAVFAASELLALGALRALREAGRRVPEDVAVACFDDSAIAATADPPLTAVRQPIEEMGREMTRMLLAAIESGDQAPRHKVLGTELVVRTSTVGRSHAPAGQ